MVRVPFVLVRSGRRAARGRNLCFITSNEGRAFCCSDLPGGTWAARRPGTAPPRKICGVPATLYGRPYFPDPLHLLLALLGERNSLDISEVNLVEITSSYWLALKEVGKFNPGSMCDFVGVATRLMALKATVPSS